MIVLFRTVNSALKKDETKPIIIPTTCSFCSFAIRNTPIITSREKKICTDSNFCLKISGSKRAVKRAIEDKHTMAIETLANFIEA